MAGCGRSGDGLAGCHHVGERMGLAFMAAARDKGDEGPRGLASMAVVEHLRLPARFVVPPLPKINRLGEWIPHVPLHPSRSPIENEFAGNCRICGRLCHRPAMDACAWEASMKLVAPALRRRMRPGARLQRWEGGAHRGQ
jgi:hypothetical protein